MSKTNRPNQRDLFDSPIKAEHRARLRQLRDEIAASAAAKARRAKATAREERLELAWATESLRCTPLRSRR